MSSEQEEDRTEYVERDAPLDQPQQQQPVVSQTPVVTQTPAGTTVVSQQPGTVPVVPPGSERKESVVRRKNTNTGAIVAMVVGAVILLLGIYLVFTRVFPYLTYPWSLLAVLLVAIIMMIVGGSLLQARDHA